MILDAASRAVLAVLAAYHVGIGVLSLIAPDTALRFASVLYGVKALDSAPLRYATRMLGLYALALGALLLLATWRPDEYRAVVAVVAGLQLARAVSRIALRRELAEAFAIPASRNAINVAVLIAEALILGVWLAVAR